ncbi:MAG: zinc-binding dehydrogenase [Candidatus Eisenbacteria bacterium]|nr:zinc-binding dehydrogenase [Candidatus Eisenbacteria bacterium]
MRTIEIREHGGPEVLLECERPLPEPGPGEVRVRVVAVSLNHLDLWVRRGVPGHTFPLPIVPGCDIAGTVDLVGPGVAGWTAGQPVLISPGSGCGSCPQCHAGRDHLCRHYGIMGETRDGGCSEALVVPATSLLPSPPGLSPAEAASVPLTLLTAWHMLVGRAAIRPGETVLVQAGGSGVGVMAIQIARLFGATVFTTVGDARKGAIARELGASEVILYSEVDFADAVRRLTGKRGVDVIVDHVGADTFERDIRSLAKGGRLVICGATSGPQATFDLRHLFFKSLSVLGSTMGGRGELDEALRFVAQGAIRPRVDRVVPMEQLADAHRALEVRSAFGKVVVAGFGIDPAEIR